MILQKLYKYAEKEKLVEDPDFEPVGIHWLINVGDNGEFLGLIPLGDVLDNKKSKGLQRFVPKRKVRSSGVAPYFLVDKPQYVFPSWTDEKKKKTFPETYHQKFTELIQAAFEDTQDKEIKAVLDFLHNKDELAKALLKLEEEKIDFSNHEISFCYEVPTKKIIENTNARNFWKQTSSIKAESQNEVLCLITGQKGSSVINHDVLKGVPGATTSGAPLISFNTDAYESYGLEGNENATITKLASEQAMAGLRKLLSDKTKKTLTIKKGKTEKIEEKEVFKNRINISDDTCAVYWLREENKETDWYLGLLESGTSASSDNARALFDSIFKGQKSKLDPNEFYLLVLKGNQGRIAISSYLEESLPKIQDNIVAWFEDLDLGEESEKKVSKGRKELLRSLMRTSDDDKKIPSRLSLELFLSVIRGSPLPRSILVMALERISQEKDPVYSGHIRRLALLKAYLLTKDRILYSPVLEGKQMDLQKKAETESEEKKKKAYVAYQLGKLFKLLTDVQYHSIGKDNSVSDFWRMASSYPSKAFGHLLERHRKIYLKKLLRGSQVERNTALNRDSRISEILTIFAANYESPESSIDIFPEVLNQEEKAVFAIGFYKQQAELYPPKK